MTNLLGKIISVTSAIAAIGAFALAANLSTAQDCVVKYLVSPRGQFVNVRSTPLVQVEPRPMRTMVAGTAEPSSRAVRSTDGHDWYQLCSGGFVQDSVANAITATPQSTETPAVVITPTRIMHNFIWCSREPEVTKINNSWFVECER